MEKRVLLALALSFLVIGFYPVILEKFYPEYAKKAQRQQIIATDVSTQPDAHSQKVSENATPAKTSQSKINDDSLSDRVLLSQNDGSLVNQKLQLVTNKEGGLIREISFRKYVDQLTNKPIALLSLSTPKYGVGLLRLLDLGDATQNALPLYEAAAGKNSVFFSAHQNDILIEKKFELIPDKYYGNLTLTFQNLSKDTQEYRYQLYAGSRVRPRHSIDSQYIEANFYSMQSGKMSLRHISETGLGKKVSSQGNIRWVAVKDRHFSIILKPKNEDTFFGLVEGLGSSQAAVSVISPKIQLKPQEILKQEFLVYMGPNELEELTPLGLDNIVNFGKMDSIGKLLVGGLELLHKVFRNYGITIIVLTLLINLILFPLTKMSFMSMKRMQLIQPQMTKLREQFKKNPEKLNKEMMELYKKHKVNPFGGCLPMLLQMPVFIALYVALSKSVILINSRFLWVKDLSSPDIVTIPFKLPFLGNEIHVLPLIMVAAMALQQKFTQIKMEGQDPAMESQQKIMTVMMPIIFGFIFYQMPSGLVLYWLTNTVWMVVYQFHLKKVTLT